MMLQNLRSYALSQMPHRIMTSHTIKRLRAVTEGVYAFDHVGMAMPARPFDNSPVARFYLYLIREIARCKGERMMKTV